MTDDLQAEVTEDTAATTEEAPTGKSSSRHRFPINFFGLFGSETPGPGGTFFKIKARGASAKNWNYRAARPPGLKRTNVIESIAHLIKSCLGGGIVSIHVGYAACGLWVATGLNVILGCLVTYGMSLLVHSAQRAYGRTRVPLMSYPDLMEAAVAIGPFERIRSYCKCFRYLVDGTIMIDLFGACICYQVIIARSIKQLVEGVADLKDEGDPPIRVYIAALLIPCIAISMITTLKVLAPFSIMANFVLLTVCIATIVYGTENAKIPAQDMPVFKSIPGLLQFSGMCSFAMGGVGVTLAIENNMEEPKKIMQVVLSGMLCVLLMVMTVGFFGYWGFGEKSKSPVTLNFPFTTFTYILKASMPLMMYVTFALNFWVPFDLAWYYLKKRHHPDRYYFVERAYRVLFVTIVTTIAVIFPEVSKIIGVLGAFCLTNMGFIYPSMISMLLEWEDPGLGRFKWRFFKNLAFFCFGMFIMTVGTTSNMRLLIKTLFKKEAPPPVATTAGPEGS